MLFIITVTALTQRCTPFLTIYLTSLLRGDPLCPVAGINFGIYICFVITFQSQVFRIFDLYTVWYQITGETKCYTVSMECGLSKRLVIFNISWVLNHSKTHFVLHQLLLFFLLWKWLFHLKVCHLFLDLKPKYLVTECILVCFEIHNFEM